MYGNFVVAKNYCSPTTNQFPHLLIFCTVLCLSRVGCPKGTSYQQPKALWAAVDWKKNIAEYPCMAGRRQFSWCWISCIKLKGCRIITQTFEVHDLCSYVFVITYALNEVVTIFEVWVQKTSTLVKKKIAKITEPICLWSPVTKVQVPWGCISFCLLFVQSFDLTIVFF